MSEESVNPDKALAVITLAIATVTLPFMIGALFSKEKMVIGLAGISFFIAMAIFYCCKYCVYKDRLPCSGLDTSDCAVSKAKENIC